MSGQSKPPRAARRAEVEVTISMRPTSGGQTRSTVARVCPVVVPGLEESRNDVVATIADAKTTLVDSAALALVDLSDTMAHLLVADPPEPARPRDVALNPDLAWKVREMYALERPLSAVHLDLLPAGSLVEVTAGKFKGRRFQQQGFFRWCHSRFGASEVSAWQQVSVPNRPPVLRVRRSDELALTYRLRLVHAPGAPRPAQGGNEGAASRSARRNTSTGGTNGPLHGPR